MTYFPHGLHLIAGQAVPSDPVFHSCPAHGEAVRFCAGTVDLVDRAAVAAEAAFEPYSQTTDTRRAEFLRRIALELEARGTDIIAIGHAETGLPETRMAGELARTTGQLRLFADHIEAGDYLDRRIDKALPDRQPLPRPEIRLVQRPVGPVAVFGASNFPLAFSTAGGDTAAALGAGCPVIVKGHTAHPATSEIVGMAVQAAVRGCDLPDGVFSLIQGGNRHVGAALVTHPFVQAVGFTGSLSGGRALFDLCAGRPDPIPFFGELGSVNPVFILPEAAKARGAEIASGWAASLVMGAGQFCTNPGIAVVPVEGAERFTLHVTENLLKVAPQTMLTEDIARAYHSGCAHMSELDGVTTLLAAKQEVRIATPQLCRVSAKDWLEQDALSEEVFGPLGLIVTVADPDEMIAIARRLKGQLTCTLMVDPDDSGLAKQLLPVLERKAGRILANGFPTGVEVCDAMVHGGPYPASTNFGATSVGTMAIRRFLRPVSYQNLPNALLPTALADK